MSKQKTILVIDDEEDLRETVEFKFQSNGFNVVTAVDGVDGLEKLDTITPDLILLDMNMPRMNGLEFYEKIKGDNTKPKHPVLVLTARANMEQLFRELDVDGFMAKPFELDQLLKEAETIIKKNASCVQTDVDSGEKRARRVCIVDNDPISYKMLTLAFLETGYIVNTAQSGASALKRIEMDIPDIAIVKLGLNDIAGDVVIQRLKRLDNTKDVKYILFTLQSGEKVKVSEQIANKEGVDQFLDINNANDLLNATEQLFS